MNEFKLIDRLIHQFGNLAKAEYISTGPGDDAAVLRVGDDRELVVSTDTLIPGVHFPEEIPPDLLGYRAVAVNVSDLAAMGADPLGITIALTIDGVDESWLTTFASGVSVAAEEYSLKILGGNLARGPMNVTMTIYGSVPVDAALLRSSARAGDDLWLTGLLGATQAYLAQPSIPTHSLEELLLQRDQNPIARYFLPHPRLQFARLLRDFAHAAIDISDGLMAEVSHIASASDCGARIQLDRVRTWAGLNAQAVVGADDSYELLFTARPDKRNRVLDAASDSHTPVILIGEMDESKVVKLMRDGERLPLPAGFMHFD